MKYIITESKMETMIKEYVLKHYDVLMVEYTTQNVRLGSGPNEKGETSITQKILNVYIENFKHQKRHSEIKEIKSSIWGVMENLFGLEPLFGYGSKWGLKVYQVKREEV
jgi:hypothetical protein